LRTKFLALLAAVAVSLGSLLVATPAQAAVSGCWADGPYVSGNRNMNRYSVRVRGTVPARSTIVWDVWSNSGHYVYRDGRQVIWRSPRRPTVRKVSARIHVPGRTVPVYCWAWYRGGN